MIAKKLYIDQLLIDSYLIYEKNNLPIKLTVNRIYYQFLVRYYEEFSSRLDPPIRDI